MKKIMALVLAAMLILGCCSFAAAEDVPEGYPAKIEGLDFGGAEVYIYDWYSTGERSENPTEEEQLTYDYRDWLEETYNCKIIEIALSDWAGNPTELANMVANKDNSKLCILGISGGFAGPAVKNELYMPWTYGLDTDQYDKMTVDFMTKDGVCYGVPGGSNVEPRQLVMFNKKVLEQANIDWNELYDLQANMEWTWDKFEEYMDKVLENSDSDGDGEQDVWALTGNGDDVTVALVVSNEADFFKVDEATGKLVPAIKDQEFLDAIQRRQDWGSKYMRPNEQWDDYQRFWPEGNVAFIIGQSYEGFNADSLVSQIGEWGAVAMPMGPNAKRYTSAADNNVFGVPAVFTPEESLKLQQIYTLYRMPAPGTEEEVEEGEQDLSWATQYYDRGCDDRAIEETYAMLRNVENATIMNFNKIGDRNSSITEVTWALGNGTPAEIAEAAWGPFQQRCDVYNGDKTQEEVDAENAAAAEAAAAEEAPAEEAAE